MPQNNIDTTQVQESPMELLLTQLSKELMLRQYALAVAESCTGGMLGAHCTSLSGSSSWFLGGFIVYANELKQHCLGVSEQTLIDHGAVSEHTIIEMALGLKKNTGAECCIAVSGVAGPGGGTPEKPVGTVWLGLSCGEALKIQCHLFTGNREAIRQKACFKALQTLHAMVVAAPQ